jgi:hypothetical protein
MCVICRKGDLLVIRLAKFAERTIETIVKSHTGPVIPMRNGESDTTEIVMLFVRLSAEEVTRLCRTISKTFGEKFMLIADMIHSCSNDKVAQAALACIGSRFGKRVRVAACKHGMDVGQFVANVVRNYALHANEEAIAMLRRDIAGAAQPLLSGLRHVVEQAVKDDAPQPQPHPARKTASSCRTGAGGRFYSRRAAWVRPGRECIWPRVVTTSGSCPGGLLTHSERL